MEEEWIVYLRENAPEMYQQAIDSLKHLGNWQYRAGFGTARGTAAQYIEQFDFVGVDEIAREIRALKIEEGESNGNKNTGY